MRIYKLVIKVKCENEYKAKYCLNRALKGLEKESIWFESEIQTESLIDYKKIVDYLRYTIKNDETDKMVDVWNVEKYNRLTAKQSNYSNILNDIINGVFKE